MSDIKPDKIVDLKGLSCPMPVVKAKKAIDGLKAGEVVLLEITDPGSKSDIPAMVKRTGNELIDITEAAGVYNFLIRKN